MRITQLLAAMLLLAGSLQAGSDQSGKFVFRIMTYNIRHGEGMDNRIDLPRIASVIRHEQADIVALQEVDKGVARTSRRDLTAELAALTGMTGVFSNNFHYQGGEYGNAILSRFPVLERTNLHYKMIRPNEQRGVLQLTLDIHGTKVRFMDTHIDYRPGDEERRLNVEELRVLIAGCVDVPVIICGDFNSTPDSKIHEMMAEFMTDSWKLVGRGPGLTIPSDKPRTRIDYIWVNPQRIRPLKMWVPQTEASDHLPVVGEFELH